MFSALSLSQQLRTSIAAVSCFGGLSKEPPVSARKGSARRASGASVDDLFDRYAPELEPMTAPGTSPSQVRSHLPPEPTPARVRLASHPETQLALTSCVSAVPPLPTSASPPAQDEDEATDRLAGLCAAIVSQDTLPPSSPRSFPFPSAVTRELKPDRGALSKPKPKPAAPQSTTVWRPRITRHKKAAAEDEEKFEDEVKPADEEDASEDEEDDEPPSPAEKKKAKPAPKGPVHRRDRNRVNARNSRAKKEHYIKWLEIKAGVTVTSQGGKDRKDAVEAAWEEEEEEEEAEEEAEAGGCEKKKRNRAAAGLTSPSDAKKRGKKKK